MSDALPPVISIVTPVFNTDPQMLRECIESVLHQSYPHFQLVLVDDASTREDTLDVLRHYDHFEARITLITRAANGGISQASNDGIEAAYGEYVALLDHDDTLNLEALGMVAHVGYHQPHIEVIYSDEDKFERQGVYFGAFYKPDWSPDLLLAQNYVNHLTVYRRSIVEEVGGFRVGYEGAQDWDLLLRVTEVTSHIHHIPEVLYHWRLHGQSTAKTVEAKPYAAVASERVLNEALARRGRRAHVERIDKMDYYRVRHHLDRQPTVSVIIPTAGTAKELRGTVTRLVDTALHGLAHRTNYPVHEIIVILSAGTDPALPEELQAIVGEIPIRFLASTGRFDFAKAINRGLLASTGELVLLLNDDIEPEDPSWLTLLVEAMEDPDVGAVGPRLLLENGRLQHAGVIHGGGMPFHPNAGRPDDVGYFGEIVLTRNFLAVTGACLLTRRALMVSVGGLSTIFPMNYNDIDYCLKLVNVGRKILYVGAAVLFHYESSTRDPTVTVHEIANYERYWRDLVDPDPFVSPKRLPSLSSGL